MTYNFNIAEHDISIVFEDATPIDGSLIQSLEPFKIESEPVNPLLKLIVTNDLKPYSPEDTELIRDIDTGNGMTLVDVLPSGGYQFHIRNLQDKLCCLLHTLLQDRLNRLCLFMPRLFDTRTVVMLSLLKVEQVKART